MFRDVAIGLQVIHAHDIAHGGTMPENVLLFRSERNDEGAPLEIYTAKISDLNLALVENGKRQTHLGGTQINAPEHDRLLDFSQLKLDDTYSLGVLYAVISCKNEEMEKMERSFDEEDGQHVPNGFVRRVIEQADTATQGSDQRDVTR